MSLEKKYFLIGFVISGLKDMDLLFANITFDENRYFSHDEVDDLIRRKYKDYSNIDKAEISILSICVLNEMCFKHYLSSVKGNKKS